MKVRSAMAIGILLVANTIFGAVSVAPALAAKGKSLCTSIDNSILNCSIPTGRSTVAGTLDPSTLTGTITVTFVNGSSWPTSGSRVTSAKFIIPTGQVLTSVHINGSSTTCTVERDKKGTNSSIVAFSYNSINVNKMSCADGDVLVINTEIADGFSLENGIITDGTAVQYKTTDSRSTKSSIWRNTGDFTVGSDGGGLGECASNSGGLVFDGPTSLPADSMWTTVSVDAASPTTFTLSAASPSSKYALFKVVLSSITATEAYKFKVEDNDLQLCILSPTKQFIAFQDDSSSLGGSFSDGYNPLIFIGGDNQVYGNQGSLSPEPYTFTAGTYYFIVNVYGGLGSGTRSGKTYVNKVANPFNP